MEQLFIGSLIYAIGFFVTVAFLVARDVKRSDAVDMDIIGLLSLAWPITLPSYVAIAVGSWFGYKLRHGFFNKKNTTKT